MEAFCINVGLLNFVKIDQTVAEMSRFLWFFKMAAAAIVDFQKFEIRYKDPICVIVPNLIEIGQTIYIRFIFFRFRFYVPVLVSF